MLVERGVRVATADFAADAYAIAANYPRRSGVADNLVTGAARLQSELA